MAPALQNRLESISGLVDATIQSVRRIATDLRPIVLDNLGLLAAIEWQVEEFQTRTGITSECHLTTETSELDRDRSTGIFRILQESLTNVMRHSGANRVSVVFGKEAGHYFLEIKDNGCGIRSADLHKSKSFGVIGIKERALLLGGEASVSGQPGRGTTVSVSIPIVHTTS
jgi:signal transduction histidine kinase